ncbi:hypothetical protein EVB32_172 [Rhizobium phage RHph_TM39]|uniref:Uncharacterized protein n=1 Tax=Rhizobium phage RHph_TM30 TaxID=2509764 RepID=A0A7S5R524_9CAUD|nr:hypothetical protein PQC16_gp171 [Rhizobium phage RHph_TM30]QIG71278.1 hypothetical protein EVB93_171 [Rhizobium phage RHph_TM30]QIG72004.1 hypothetical protein EVB95_170 [Rhizobium phage RHph_TM2_3B]QIG72367.1 hypothetical protein EVB96_171 [Rhizobium phage RHph_TM3_3_6]QIG77160.1 hypothetical protein EVB32_172 [Rhizobium phage RHph_TM39]
MKLAALVLFSVGLGWYALGTSQLDAIHKCQLKFSESTCINQYR